MAEEGGRRGRADRRGAVFMLTGERGELVDSGR